MYKPEISKNHAALHDLIERWNKACDETYIVSGRDKFWMTRRAAEALAQSGTKPNSGRTVLSSTKNVCATGAW